MHMKRRSLTIAILCLACCTSAGCAWTEGGVRKTVVIGFGVIESTPVPTDEHDHSASISNTRVLGIFLGGAPGFSGFVAGYAQSQSVEVSTEANALIETVTYDDGTLRVNVSPVIVRPDEVVPAGIPADKGDDR